MRGTGVPWNRWSKRVSLGAQRQTVKETRVSWHVPAGRGGTGDLSVNAREKSKNVWDLAAGQKSQGVSPPRSRGGLILRNETGCAEEMPQHLFQKTRTCLSKEEGGRGLRSLRELAVDSTP